jgi:hypothetical protein
MYIIKHQMNQDQKQQIINSMCDEYEEALVECYHEARAVQSQFIKDHPEIDGPSLHEMASGACYVLVYDEDNYETFWVSKTEKNEY